MADLETQIRTLADRRYASTSAVTFTGESHLSPHDRSQPGATTPIDGTETIMLSSNTTRPGRSWYLIGAAAALVAVVVVGVALVASDDDPAPPTATPTSLDADETTVDETGGAGAPAQAEQPGSTTTTAAPVDEVELATAFWEALAAGDRDTALGLVSTDLLDPGAVSQFGRAQTLEGQFDWYESVGWVWTFEGCVMGDTGFVECTANGSNAWSDALGIEPVPGTFRVRFDDEGIVLVDDVFPSFESEWVRTVFSEFAEWVQANHPEDADVMFNLNDDVNPEILGLYEVNTERFVDAQQGD